jgi:hypothetical protein
VITCASSCQSVACQLNVFGGRAFGESMVTTRPKHAPSAPRRPGRPSVRTAKSSCFGKISTRIGPVGVKAYRFVSAAIASCASAGAYSLSTATSLLCMRNTNGPCWIV